MSREIYQKYGLIVAVIIAGIALPTSIVSFMRDPIINNYYEQNYYVYNNQSYYNYNQTYYYNQTFYGVNETDYSKPLEQMEYYNLTRYDCIIRNLTLSSNFAYWYYWNASTSFQFRFYVTRGFFYDTLVELNGTLTCYQFLETIKTYQTSATGTEFSSYYVPPFLSEWLFIFMMDQASITVNITLTDEILKL